MVGSAEQSGGGVASVLRLMKTMPFWEKYHCGWLGTQIQRGYGVKLWYAVKAYFKALFTIWQYDIVHFHTVPDKICLIIHRYTRRQHVHNRRESERANVICRGRIHSCSCFW